MYISSHQQKSDLHEARLLTAGYTKKSVSVSELEYSLIIKKVKTTKSEAKALLYLARY
jgi:hypothetical protein